MKNTVQYIVDTKGIKTSVIVPCEQWDKINSDLIKLQNKLRVFAAIQDGFKEMKAAKKNGTELQSLSDFLHEEHN